MSDARAPGFVQRLERMRNDSLYANADTEGKLFIERQWAETFAVWVRAQK